MEAGRQLSGHEADVAYWAANKGLTISVSKSHFSLFSSDTHQYSLDPGVTWGRESLPRVQNPKILGVTLDPLLNFSNHISITAERAKSRLNIMRALAGTN